MNEYLFVYEPRTRAFAVRYWVDRGGGVPSDATELDGSVPATEVEAMIAHLRTLFPEPRYSVARMTASSWETVDLDYPGLSRD